MKTTVSLSKKIFVLVAACILVAAASVASGQRRAKVRRAESRAAGLVDEADKLADERKWSDAIDAYKLAIRLDANYAPAHGGLGDAYLSSGNPEQALAEYKEQVRLAPNDAQAQFDLGYFYNHMGRHGEAFAPLVKATQLDPTFAEAFYGIGYAYLRGADFEKSLGFFRSAIRLKPDYAEAYYGLGQAYAKMGKTDLANEQKRKLSTFDAKLAQKLEKDIQGAMTETASTPSSQAGTPETVAQQSQIAASQPATQTEQPTARLVDPMQASSRKPAPQTEVPAQATATSDSAQEPASRQLQQGPAQSQTSSSPATPSTETTAAPQTNQINALPVKTKRWALIIGVDKYIDGQISSLKGAANDARLLADALVRYAGFPQDQVIVLSTDQPTERQPTRVNILRRLSNLTAAVPRDALLVVSFAGHGMERGGQAFLLPTDAQISDSISFLEDTAISVNRMKDLIRATGVGQVMVLLDACRNDPGGRADAPNPLTQAYMRGFSFDVANREVQAFATIYATAVGQRAYEYTEKRQGYFTWAIVEGLKGGAANDKGEVTLSQLVKFVQETVPKRIAIDLGGGKQQRPFANIEGYRADDLVLAIAAPGAAGIGPSGVPGTVSVDPAAIELAYWDTIKNSTNPEDFKAYLEKYPDGQFAEIAKLRTQPSRPAASSGSMDSNSVELAYWGAIKDSRNPADFGAYITKFPNGVFVDLAKSRISSLEAEARERERISADAAATDRARNTHIFDVKDAAGTEGSLTVAPGSLSFEPKKANAKKNVAIQCSEIKRVESGQSAFLQPHVNIFLNPAIGNGDGKAAKSSSNRQVVFFTSSGGQGLFVNKPIVDLTANVLNAIIDACKMARVNQ